MIYLFKYFLHCFSLNFSTDLLAFHDPCLKTHALDNNACSFSYCSTFTEVNNKAVSTIKCSQDMQIVFDTQYLSEHYSLHYYCVFHWVFVHTKSSIV